MKDYWAPWPFKNCVLKWCLCRHSDYFYCRPYPSKKAAKFNLNLKKGNRDFYITQLVVYE